MSLKTKIFAEILFSQGFFEEALEIYQVIELDEETRSRIKALTSRKRFKVDLIKLEEFKTLKNIENFEKWLIDF